MERNEGELKPYPYDDHRLSGEQEHIPSICRNDLPRDLRKFHRAQPGIDEGHSEKEKGGRRRCQYQVLDARFIPSVGHPQVGYQGIERDAEYLEAEKE